MGNSNNRVTKADLVSRISETTGFRRKDVEAIIKAEQDVIVDAMANGESVILVGYGTYKVQDVKARNGRNVQTGEAIKIPAHKRVKFAPGKKFVDAVAVKAAGKKKSK